MGDLPLRTPTDRSPGGPLPRQQANRTHPHPLPILFLCLRSHAGPQEHRALISLSEGCSRAAGRLDTCYSPIRRSPPYCIAATRDAPRLACVKPVASVHPEPGSNSSLYKSISSPVAAASTCSALLHHTKGKGLYRRCDLSQDTSVLSRSFPSARTPYKI